MLRQRVWRIGALLGALLLLWSCQGGESWRWVAFGTRGDGYVHLEVVPSGSPVTGSTVLAVDLDADGRPETASLQDGQVRVERDGVEIWRSKPEWRVVDIAVGDVENDLRQELLLAMWRKNDAGLERSQPYIIGYRGGRYDLIWGGSAVADPIYDFDVGDVDGDGQSELVVLEGSYGDPEGSHARFITVWRWNGWGFTLIWRSAQGEYRYLQLQEVEEGGGVEIVVNERIGE